MQAACLPIHSTKDIHEYIITPVGRVARKDGSINTKVTMAKKFC